MAVQCMIESDRPGLALYFPELVTNRVSLADLREQHSPLAKAMDLLAKSLNLRVHNPSYPLKGYGQVLGCIAKEAARACPLGVQSSRFRPFRAARSAYLRPSACAPSWWTACPTFHVHPVAHYHRSVAVRPNELSAAWPCLQWAFAAYPRPGEAGPAVFHGPIARGQALDSPGLPRPTDADEQTTSGSAFQIEGICCARFADG